MSNTYHYSLWNILLIFEDLKGFVRTRIITKSLAHIVTICAKGLAVYHVDTVIKVVTSGTRYKIQDILLSFCAYNYTHIRQSIQEHNIHKCLNN